MKKLSILLLVIGFSAAFGAEPDRISIKVETGRFDFFVGDELVTRYYTGSDLAKPYFWPLNAPGAVPVTRGWPMEKGLPKETTDHVHQKSGWFCHGDVIPEGVTTIPSSDKSVKGVDTWSETRGHGRIVCVSNEKISDSALQTRNVWQDAAGTKFLEETRVISLQAAGPGRLLVLDINLDASICPITFGDTKEGAIGVRVNDQIRLTAKGPHSNLVDADGKSGETDVWGMFSNWCDYSGEVDGKLVGIAIFDATTNKPRACWHARAYGLMAANPFGRNRSGFPAQKGQTELVKLAKGEHLRFRYGIYLHTGDSNEGKVADAYEQFSKLR
jgi:hypothetical protein